MTQKADHNDDEHENLAWLDLETTGLNAETCVILEVGIIVTTKDLDFVSSHAIVTHPFRKIGKIDPYVLEMHTKSGLIEESNLSIMTLGAAVDELREFMQVHSVVGSPMCGNTINFDRAFSKVQMPALNELFHYRNIDVSTLKNVMKMHFPEVAPFEKPADLPHRVLEDLKLTIAEYKYYLGIIESGALFCD